MMTKQKARIGIAGLVLAAICCLAMALPCQSAFALETPDYTTGEEYYIDDEQAFQEQDIEHKGAVGNSASTSYYLVSTVEETTSVTFVPAEPGGSSSLAKSGDAFPSSLFWLFTSAILASLSLMMSLRICKKND